MVPNLVQVYQIRYIQSSGVTRGGKGAECPPETCDCEIFPDVSGKKSQGKKGKGVKIEKKRRKTVKGKVENGNGSRKCYKKRWGPFFFFFLLFTFENDGNLFWVYQNGNFLLGKNISRREKKSGKIITLPPQKNTPVTPLIQSHNASDRPKIFQISNWQIKEKFRILMKGFTRILFYPLKK